jgi:hypothetical protein
MTKLIIKITDVAPLPGNIVLSLRNDKTGSEELEGKSIELNNGEYAWIGPIQIGDFTATVMISRSQPSLVAKFTNRRVLLPFLDNVSSLIQIRNGSVKPAEEVAEVPQTTQRDISIGPLSANTDRIQLFLIAALDNKLTAQYVGVPIPSWRPSVPDGRYKLIIIEYERDQTKCAVRKRRS